MKKFLGIVVLSLLLLFDLTTYNSAYSEIITFSNCANDKHNFIFQSDIYEKRVHIIDTDKKIISKTTIFTDAHVKKENEENPDTKQTKYYFSEDKIHSFNEFLVKTKRKIKINNVEDITETIYDLETKKIQVDYSIYRDGNFSQRNVFIIKCQ